ncbi:hypothetical protein QFZ62_000142 [Clavibacter sp. B3I6]|uniref:hypothetical protein n=1 Tax=Clavibacter sp. B3I6 TaxID=3042268 RepID=UPI0027886E66|nr:hypothetical protein [Clavibacter sp. B3I6]MDQ0742834.1 hypothetical protein [Clavibacter sp. B3I6]
MGVQEDKRERILGAADALFEPVVETRVQRVLRLPEDDVALLLGMGPSAHHMGARTASPDAPDAPGTGSGAAQDVTIDVMIHVLRRRDDVASA